MGIEENCIIQKKITLTFSANLFVFNQSNFPSFVFSKDLKYFSRNCAEQMAGRNRIQACFNTQICSSMWRKNYNPQFDKCNTKKLLTSFCSFDFVLFLWWVVYHLWDGSLPTAQWLLPSSAVHFVNILYSITKQFCEHNVNGPHINQEFLRHIELSFFLSFKDTADIL